MAKGSRLDSTFGQSHGGRKNLALPYQSTQFEPFTDNLDNDHKLVGLVTTAGSSLNVFVTPGGGIERRPRWIKLFPPVAGTGIISGRHVQKVWGYSTLPDTGGVVYEYLIASAYNPSTLDFELYYCPMAGLPAWTAFTNVRDCNGSSVPHLLTISKGKAYIKGFPNSSEKLGTIIFDGSGGTVTIRPWGMLPPTTPARVEGWIGKLTVLLTATATSATVSANSAPPATPFVVQLENEQCNCTATAGAGPYTLTITREYNGTTATEHAVGLPVLHRSWAASSHKVEVNSGWQYVYCKKTITNHISSRSPLETNPDLLPSNTGPFFDLIPDMTYEGDADTTNIPKFVFYRSNDGGGTFLELEEITNPGSGARVYTDDSLASGTGSTFSDPIPDKDLPTALAAPSPDSNNPPPTVNSPLVVGVDTPSINTSNMVTWQGRIWYAIDHILYCSNNEETKAGNPEEAWEYGDNATLYVFPDRIISLQATSSSLYAMGTQNTYRGTGTDKLSFAFNVISSDFPICGSKYASTSFLDRVAFVTSDLKVAIITGESIETVSEPLVSLTATSSNRIQMVFHTVYNFQWLMILVPNDTVSTSSTMWIYDWGRSVKEGRDFWFPPWTGSISTLMSYSRNADVRILYAFDYDNASATKSSGPVTLSIGETGTSLSDEVVLNSAWSTRSFAFAAKIWPWKNPAGNHLNSKAVPHTTTTFAYVKIDYKANENANIGLTIFFDNDSFSSGADVTSSQSLPTRRAASTGYYTKEFRFHQVGDDFALYITNGTLDQNTWLRVDRVAVGFLPSGGPDAAGQG